MNSIYILYQLKDWWDETWCLEEEQTNWKVLSWQQTKLKGMNHSVQGLVTAFSSDDILPLTSPLSWEAGTFSLPDTVAQMTHTNNVSLSWSQGGSGASCSYRETWRCCTVLPCIVNITLLISIETGGRTECWQLEPCSTWSQTMVRMVHMIKWNGI